MEKIMHRSVFKLITVPVVFILFIIFCAIPVIAETLPVLDGNSLIEQALELNGLEVVFQGEVIGDIMPRGDHYWINVLNNGTAIGIWITADQRQTIGPAGRYGIQGDKVRITGVFYKACVEHGGDLDIHANSLEIVTEGHRVEQRLHTQRLILALVLFLFAVCSMIVLIGNYRNKQSGIK